MRVPWANSNKLLQLQLDCFILIKLYYSPSAGKLFPSRFYSPCYILNKPKNCREKVTVTSSTYQYTYLVCLFTHEKILSVIVKSRGYLRVWPLEVRVDIFDLVGNVVVIIEKSKMGKWSKQGLRTLRACCRREPTAFKEEVLSNSLVLWWWLWAEIV